ncbi:GNAT family N-acetyltransferase (plasmid) [Deinococcus sp. D7000]|nr:GNAT family N-acetyltransferase [Deinococcus sp. D7000]
MHPFTVQHPTTETFPDLVALVPDPGEAAKRSNVLSEQIAAGQLKLEQFLILRSGRGVEGLAMVNDLAQVPIFPHLRADTPDEAITTLAQALQKQAHPGQQLILTDAFAPLNSEPMTAAGWLLDGQHAVYETDLRARSYPVDTQAQIVNADRPDIRALMAQLGQGDWEGSEDWTLIALTGADGRPVALCAVGPGGRPDTANLNMIGVLSQARGQGLGTRLHAHVLALAAQKFARHNGGTEVDNVAMRRIFEKHGSRLMATQMYFKLKS